MGRDVDRDVQAPRSSAAWTDFTLVGQADLVSLVDARGDRDAQLLALLDTAVAPARFTGLLDDPALTAAARAGRDVDHLPQHRLANRPNLLPRRDRHPKWGIRAVSLPILRRLAHVGVAQDHRNVLALERTSENAVFSLSRYRSGSE